MDAEEVRRAVRSALVEAREEKIIGQAVTPFLLEKMSEITGGESLRANLGLLLNNATIASQIAQVINPRRKTGNLKLSAKRSMLVLRSFSFGRIKTLAWVCACALIEG